MADVKGFIAQYAPVASQVSQKIGVAPDVLLGQWGLETGWGKSVIPGTNNLGNIKGPGVAATDNQTGSNDQYRQYSTPQAFGNDFASLIGRRYQGATGTGSDANAFGAALSKGGYAEDPNYANKLSSAVGMVRKFGDALASAFSGTATASELTPAQMSGAPVISATGQRINMPQAQQQAAPQQSAPVSTGDPLLDMAHGMLSGSAPAAQPASAPSAPATTDDPLLAMAHSVLASKDTAPAAAQAAPAAPAASAGPQPGGVTSFLAGVGRGVQQTALGAQQLLGHGLQAAGATTPGNWLVNDADKGLAQGATDVSPYSAAHPIATGAGQLAGGAAATAPLALVAPEVAGAGLLGKIGIGAGVGAVSGALTPVENVPQGSSFAAEKAKQIGLGAVTGGVATPLVSAIGGVVSPAIGAAQQKLIDAGVPLTPGQIMGGAAARTEAKLTSVPFLGDMIKNGQQRAVQGFNQATYDQVLAPLGQKYSGPIGNEGVANVQKTISNAYDDALSKLTFHADPQFTTDMANLGGMAQSLPAAQQSQFLSIIKNQIAGKLSPQGTMDGQTLKGVQSELGRISKGLTGDPSYDNQQLGQAVAQVKNLVEGALPRSNPADAVSDLANANAAYANFVRLRGAAGSQGAMNNDGVFTAGQLNNAVRGADKSAGKGATATGNALMQDFSSAGQSVLGSKYPDSGTPGRSLMALMGPAALGQAFAPGVAAPMAAAMGVGALPYTAMGQKVAQMLLTARPGFAGPLGSAIKGSAALAAPVANSLTQAIGQSK
jgi:hypothetical protein